MVLNYPVLYKSMDAKMDAIVAQAVQTAIADASTLWAPLTFDGVFPIKGFGIKQLEAWDIDPADGTQGHVNTNEWLLSFGTARTWINMFSDVICDDIYVILTGVFNYDATPDVTHMKITADGIEYPVMSFDEMYGWDVAVAYFSHPIIVRPEKKMVINMYANTAGQKNFGFLGYTIGKRARLLTQMS